MNLREILALAPVIPVLTIKDSEQAVPLVRALAGGGLRAVEITLRSEAALDAIRQAASGVPEAVVGAGTVLTAEDLAQVEAAGARFAASPGATPALVRAAGTSRVPLLPGAATPSEVMQLTAAGFRHIKFFPAEAAGGVAMLKAFAGPFSSLRFCPTGGIGPANARSYLALPNVTCVGGSWVAPAEAVQAADWPRITSLSREAAGLRG